MIAEVSDRAGGERAGGWQAAASNIAGLAAQGAFIAVLATGGARVASGAIGVGTGRKVLC